MGKNKLLKTMLKKIHEKCVKAKEAYQQSMELYLQETRVPTAKPSQGSNKIEALKQEIKGLQERNKDLSDKLTQSEAKSTQTVKTGEVSSSKDKSKLTNTDLN